MRKDVKNRGNELGQVLCYQQNCLRNELKTNSKTTANARRDAQMDPGWRVRPPLCGVCGFAERGFCRLSRIHNRGSLPRISETSKGRYLRHPPKMLLRTANTAVSVTPKFEITKPPILCKQRTRTKSLGVKESSSWKLKLAMYPSPRPASRWSASELWITLPRGEGRWR